MSTFKGAIGASDVTIRHYLTDNYRIGEEPMTASEADALMAKHADEVETGVRFGSFAYYVGDRIAEAEELTYVGTEDDEEEEADDA